MKHLLILTLLITANTYITYGQTKRDRVEGVYLNIDQFIKNEPEAIGFRLHDKSDPESTIERPHLQRRFCSIAVETEEPVEDVWGFAIEGRAFIKHKNCYFPISQFGRLCTFYYSLEILTSATQDAAGNLQDFKIGSTVMEKVLDVKTGDVLDQKTNSPRIVEIIKSDDFFQDEKIKRKELGMYISRYNKRHPLSEFILDKTVTSN